MGITSNDIAAQRAMLERGEEKRKADWKQAERERLRDTFAAAALTGLLSLNRPGPNQQFPTELCERAFRWADAMLREQDKQSVGVAEMDSVADRKSVATPRACASSCSQPFDSAPTTHDAVPEAKAANDGRTPKDADGTGNTPSKAEIDALEYVVEEGRIASMDDYGILRSWLIRLRPEWESQSYEESNEKRANATMNRDDTPGQGSVQGEGTLTDIVADAKVWLADIKGGQRLQTHSGQCHRWHSTCLVLKLIREIEVQRACTAAGRDEIARLRRLS